MAKMQVPHSQSFDQAGKAAHGLIEQIRGKTVGQVLVGQHNQSSGPPPAPSNVNQELEVQAKAIAELSASLDNLAQALSPVLLMTPQEATTATVDLPGTVRLSAVCSIADNIRAHSAQIHRLSYTVQGLTNALNL